MQADQEKQLLEVYRKLFHKVPKALVTHVTIIHQQTNEIRYMGTRKKCMCVYVYLYISFQNLGKLYSAILATDDFMSHKTSLFHAIMALTFSVHGLQKHVRYPPVRVSVENSQGGKLGGKLHTIIRKLVAPL